MAGADLEAGTPARLEPMVRGRPIFYGASVKARRWATAFSFFSTAASPVNAIWPFTRLVHAFSAPIGYLFRPYIVYRSRDAGRPGDPVGSRPRRRGW